MAGTDTCLSGTATIVAHQSLDAPDEFRPECQPNRHIAFGTGIHFCLGAHLARMEGDVALQFLLERIERLDADLSDLEPLSGLYGLESLPCDVAWSERYRSR